MHHVGQSHTTLHQAAVGGASCTATAPPTPSLQRARSQSVSSTEARETVVQDARVRRFQHGLLHRRLQIAKGTLQFNLVRLRSEFNSLFGNRKDSRNGSGRLGDPKRRNSILSKRGK